MMDTNVSSKNIAIESKDNNDVKYNQSELNQNLKRASKYGDLEKVKYFVSKGADVHAKDDYTFRWTSINGHVDGSRGHNFYGSPIIWASHNGHLDVIKFLFSIDADIHTDNVCAVTLAGGKGHLDVVKFLFSVGADIGAHNGYAIRWTSHNGHLEVVKFLVSVGADAHVCDYEAFILASRNGHLEVVKFLVSVGANIHSHNDYAIKWASRNGHLDVVKFLISKGADIQYISIQMKIEIFGSKIRDFYSRRKKIV